MTTKKATVHDGGAPTKLRLRDSFPGQTRFTEVSPPLGFPTLIVLIVVAIVAAVFVLWLKS